MLLEVKHLTYKTDRRTMLNNINFKLDRGGNRCSSWSFWKRKSTFLKQLNNLISPTEGELLFKGKPYDEYRPEELRSKISYMMQQSELFGTTVGDNMAFPALTHYDRFDEDKANDLLNKVGLSNYSLDSKIEHMSGENVNVLLLRQLMYQPEILLLDESTSALDTQNKEKLKILSLN